MRTQQTLAYIRFIITELFYVSLVTFCFFSFLESVSSGFVSHSINPDILLYLTLGTGVLGFFLPATIRERDEDLQKKTSQVRTAGFAIVAVSIVCGLFVYIQMRDQGGVMAILLGLVSSILVALITLTALSENSDDSR